MLMQQQATLQQSTHTAQDWDTDVLEQLALHVPYNHQRPLMLAAYQLSTLLLDSQTVLPLMA